MDVVDDRAGFGRGGGPADQQWHLRCARRTRYRPFVDLEETAAGQFLVGGRGERGAVLLPSGLDYVRGDRGGAARHVSPQALRQVPGRKVAESWSSNSPCGLCRMRRAVRGVVDPWDREATIGKIFVHGAQRRAAVRLRSCSNRVASRYSAVRFRAASAAFVAAAPGQAERIHRERPPKQPSSLGGLPCLQRARAPCTCPFADRIQTRRTCSESPHGTGLDG